MLDISISNFHFFCIICLLVNTILVYNSKNSVHSVLFLIGAFINSVIILFIFKIEFMSLVFLFIYIGAIAVLFLFIVMMLPTKYDFIPLKEKFLLIVFILCSFYLLTIFKFYNLNKINNILLSINELENLFTLYSLDKTSDILIFSFSLYNYNSVLVLIAGLVLLVAMLGAILLTADFKTIYKAKKSKNSLSRTIKTITLYK